MLFDHLDFFDENRKIKFKTGSGGSTKKRVSKKKCLSALLVWDETLIEKFTLFQAQTTRRNLNCAVSSQLGTRHVIMPSLRLPSNNGHHSVSEALLHSEQCFLIRFNRKKLSKFDFGILFFPIRYGVFSCYKILSKQLSKNDFETLFFRRYDVFSIRLTMFASSP